MTELTERQNRLVENSRIWYQIETLASQLNAGEVDEEYGISKDSKGKLLNRIREARRYIEQVWNE
jgi:hypothetical protein